MNPTGETPLETDCSTVQTRLSAGEDFLLLDCREQQEFEIVQIAGATLLPMSEIQERIGELNEWKERSVVVYCHHGGRSLQVANYLRQQGWSKAQSMAGGVDGWAVQIDPSLPRY